MGRRPLRTEAIPNARGFRVYPSAERPCEHRHPRASRSWPATSSAAVYLNHSATYWISRSGLPYDRYLLKPQVFDHLRSITSAGDFRIVSLRGTPALISILEISPFAISSSIESSRWNSAQRTKSGRDSFVAWVFLYVQANVGEHNRVGSIKDRLPISDDQILEAAVIH